MFFKASTDHFYDADIFVYITSIYTEQKEKVSTMAIFV